MTENGGRPLGSRYRIGELIGRGGMGEVWRGTDETGAPVAVKTLQQQFAGDPGIVQRFVAERHLLTGVQDPGVVRVRDMVAEGATLAIVMDLIQGTDLRAYLRERGTLPAAEACRLGAQVAYGLSAIHSARIVHRDVKPENVLLDQAVDPPRAMLTDFGVSKLLEEGPDQAKATVLAGTPLYLAPELILGETPGPRSDIYSLGIILYELVCGVTPFTGMTQGAVLHAHTATDPGRPDGFDDRLWNLVAQLVSKDPAQRPADAGVVARALEELAGKLDGRVALTRLDAPPSAVPAQPYRVSPGGPTVEATQLGTPQQGLPGTPAPVWNTPTTLGLPAGQGGLPTPGASSVPGYPSSVPGYPSQPSFTGAGAPGPMGYGSMTPQGMPMAAGYAVAASQDRTKRSWQLPVAVGVSVALVAVAAFWLLNLRDQPIAATPVTTTEASSQASPSQTPSPTPTPTTVPAAASPAAEPTTVAEDAAAEGTAALPTGAGAYADGFVRAWGIGDRPAASRYASADTVASLFQYDARGGSTWKRESSLVQEARTQVRYTDGTGASLYLLVDNATAERGAPAAIVGANVEWDDTDNTYDGEAPTYDYGIAAPEEPTVVTGLESTAGEYADALVRAWGVGDRSAADAYASDEALSAMFGTYGSGGSHWRRTSATSSSATYANDDGTLLTLYLDPTTVSAGRGEGVYGATFS